MTTNEHLTPAQAIRRASKALGVTNRLNPNRNATTADVIKLADSILAGDQEKPLDNARNVPQPIEDITIRNNWLGSKDVPLPQPGPVTIKGEDLGSAALPYGSLIERVGDGSTYVAMKNGQWRSVNTGATLPVGKAFLSMGGGWYIVKHIARS